MEISHISINTIKRMLSDSDNLIELLAAMRSDTRMGVQKLLQQHYKNQSLIEEKRKKAEYLQREEKELWENGYDFIGGIDEAGRGPLAGPVVSACVILPPKLVIEGVDDSKKLVASKRNELYDLIIKKAVSIGIGIVDNKQIDKVNIYNATIQSMEMAIESLNKTPEYLLIDAMELKNIDIPQKSIIGGDGKSQSIAAASIIAKVTRDRIMEDLSKEYPGYSFDKHKGYGTKAHILAIKELGLSPIHRRSFVGNIFKE